MAKSLATALAGMGISNAEKSAPSRWLDTGYPVLNHRVSGDYFKGLPMGRMIEVFGPPSAGKTAIATKCMVAAQQAGGVAIFEDHENSFDLRLGKNIGLSDDPNNWIYRQPDTFEDSIDGVVKICELIRSGDFGVEADAPICVVFDSLASMVPKSKWDSDAADYNMNDNTALARATSAAFPAFAKKMNRLNVCVIILNQARTKIGVMFGDPTSTPGGAAPEFYSSVRLKLGGAKITEGEKYKDPKTGKMKTRSGVTTGKTVGCETVKNKTYRPFQKCSWDFIFQEDGSGHFDAVGGVLEELKTIGAIDIDGNYYVWSDGKKYYKKALTKKIEDENLVDELYALLPKAA